MSIDCLAITLEDRINNPLLLGACTPCRKVASNWLIDLDKSCLFIDDMEFMLEGLESTVPDVQRSAAIEFAQKMCDDAFARKARSTDYLNHAWTAFGDIRAFDTDPVGVSS